MAVYSNEPILDMFVFETSQLIEQLEQIIISSDKSACYDREAINEIFRIMHTIKGSSAMMNFDNISKLTHTVEDLFNYLRNEKPFSMDCSKLSDIVLESVDFMKAEMQKIENGNIPDRDSSLLTDKITRFLEDLKLEYNSAAAMRDTESMDQEAEICGINSTGGNSPFPGRAFKAVIRFTEGCEMESVRAYALIHRLKDVAVEISHIPERLADNDKGDAAIRSDGFKVWFKTDLSYEELHDYLSKTIFLSDMELMECSDNKDAVYTAAGPEGLNTVNENRAASSHNNIISVNIVKLDKLMDLVGELVISEAMVTQNPDLAGMPLSNFKKAARQHRKIINELQDIAMSIRMVPLSSTFQRLNRIVRDMSKKLNKDVELKIIGEETEVDKNIIEHISDPLMHLIRNSIDHGIESADDRMAKGKPESGTVILEAKNAGGDVLITVSDDGAGLDKDKILDKARRNGLINRPESELLDKDIYSCVFLPGFSTKDEATEFSGRGVGMDVVMKNICVVGGDVSIDSMPGQGTAITMKIPLTLAIMDGMTIRVGKAKFTIPITSIRESFKAKQNDLIKDPDNNEMIMIRGECYPILRLHEMYRVKTDITDIPDGITVMVESDGKAFCIFADELIGQQQVVVKALPEYIKKMKKVKGVEGCTLLGDGSISLILDVAGFQN